MQVSILLTLLQWLHQQVFALAHGFEPILLHGVSVAQLFEGPLDATFLSQCSLIFLSPFLILNFLHLT